MTSKSDSCNRQRRPRSVFKSALIGIYVVALLGAMVVYLGLLFERRSLSQDLDALVAERGRLEENAAEVTELATELQNRSRLRESATVQTDYALSLMPFEDLDTTDCPFFIASHRPFLNRKGMEVIVNLPPGDQRFRVAFPAASDLKKKPSTQTGYWLRDALHYESSRELVLECGECYQISYGFVENENETELRLQVRTREAVIVSEKIPYQLKADGIHIYGAGTRNTSFLPGEVADPFVLVMKGVQRPTTWDWAMLEKSEGQPDVAHHLQFSYENQPPAFIVPGSMARFESTRRFYHWSPLALSDTFEELNDEEKFVFKAFPDSTGRKSKPLY